MTSQQRTRPRVALVVDHPQRDLDGLVLVAAHLARVGADALLVPMYQKHEAQLLGADVIVVNYVRAANLPFLKSSRRLGLPTVVLDTEGGVVSDKTRYAERISAYLEYADLYLVWGEALGAALEPFAKARGVPVQVTGCPRFDFTAAPWRDTLPRPASLPPDRPYVLVNTNFPIINPRFQTAEQERSQLLAMGFTAEYLDERWAQTHAAREQIAAAVRELSTRMPELLFVLRPHPFEDRSWYDRTLAGLPGVKVASEGPVFPWLRHATALLHHNCSTAIEAFMLGVEAIHAAWIPGEHLAQPETQRVSTLAAGVDEAEAAIRTALAGRTVPVSDDVVGMRRQVVRQLLHETDGRAGQRVAEALLDVARRDGRREQGTRAVVAAQEGWLRRAQTAAATLLGSARVDRLRALLGRRLSPEKRFTSADVQAILRKLGSVEPGFADVIAAPAGVERNGRAPKYASVQVSLAPRRAAS